ncbi:MAG: SpoIIE family protein phosphatase [Acidobacteriota bacterium]
MPPPSSSVVDSELWRELFTLEQRGVADRRALDELLGRWARARGLSAASLDQAGSDADAPSSSSGDDSRLASFGLETGGDETLDATLELPSGTLRWRQAADGASEDGTGLDADSLLLAAAARVCGLKRQLEQETFQAMFRGVEMEVLHEIGRAIASTLDVDALGEEILVRAVSLVDARRGALYLLEGEHYVLASVVGGEARPRLESGEADVAALEAAPAEAEAPLPGAAHLLGAAVEVDGDPRGVLIVADKESRRGVGPFVSADRRTLALIASQAAVALENAKLHHLALEKERLERDMELASEIQQKLLPQRPPSVDGFEMAGWNRPARQVGGDYFDFRPVGNGRIGLTVGDVSGKGMPAALLVSTLHSALSVLLDRGEQGSAMIEVVNRHICESSGLNKFITVIYAALDAERAEVEYLNAGHNPGVLLRASGTVEELGSTGVPLGLLPSATFEEATLHLEPGDLLCLYSDGITECAAPSDEEFGLDRLVELLAAMGDRPLNEILSHIDATMLAFADGLPQGDDQTVVLLRRLP